METAFILSMLINLILITVIILMQGGFQTFAAYKQAILRKPVIEYYNVHPQTFRGEVHLDARPTLDYWFREAEKNYKNAQEPQMLTQFIMDRYRDTIIESLLESIQKHLTENPTLIAVDIALEDYRPKIRFASKIAFFPFEKEKTLSVVITNAMNTYPRTRFF